MRNVRLCQFTPNSHATEHSHSAPTAAAALSVTTVWRQNLQLKLGLLPYIPKKVEISTCSISLVGSAIILG